MNMSESAAQAATDAGHVLAETPYEPASLHRGGDFAGGRPRGHGRATRWSGTRMIAVTAERLAIAEDLAGTTGYLPAIPADSEDRSFD